MTTLAAPQPPPIAPRHPLDRWATARHLVVLQGAILVAMVVEALAFSALLDPAALGPATLTGVAAVVTLLTAAGLGRRSRRVRRWAMVAEAMVLLMATVDVAIARVLTGGDVPLMLVVARVAVPIVVMAVLWRPGPASWEGTTA